MNGYFSSLIRQTGISLDDQGPNRAYQPNPGESRAADLYNHPERSESLEVEEIVEVTAPPDPATSAHHEMAKKVDKDNQNTNTDVKEIVKQEPTESLKHLDRSIVQTPGTSVVSSINQVSNKAGLLENITVKADSNIKQSEPIQARQEKSDQDDATHDEKELSATERGEFITEFVSNPALSKKSNSSKLQSEIEQTVITETTDSPSPASIEQHVYISQLPDSYQQAIKEWLTSPAEGSKDQLSSRENLKKAIKSKQNSKVILQPEQNKNDNFPSIQIGNEQLKPRDLHLSVGNINLTIEEPKTTKQQVPQTTNKPTRRQSSGSSRLSRHYVRGR